MEGASIVSGNEARCFVKEEEGEYKRGHLVITKIIKIATYRIFHLKAKTPNSIPHGPWDALYIGNSVSETNKQYRIDYCNISYLY